MTITLFVIFFFAHVKSEASGAAMFRSTPCEQVDYIKSSKSYFFSFLLQKKYCKVTYKVSGKDREKTLISEVCPVAESPKLVFIRTIMGDGKDRRWYRDYIKDVEVVNDLSCRFVKDTKVGIAGFYNTVSLVKNIFEEKRPNLTIQTLKNLGFKVLKKENKVWSFHVYPATQVDFEIENSSCFKNKECEDEVKVIRLLKASPLYIIEDDNGNIVSVSTPTQNKDIKLFGRF